MKAVEVGRTINELDVEVLLEMSQTNEIVRDRVKVPNVKTNKELSKIIAEVCSPNTVLKHKIMGEKNIYCAMPITQFYLSSTHKELEEVVENE